MGNLLYENTTYDIRGACFSVWKVFGGAFKEKAVERALVIELHKTGRKIETQKKIEILYEGQTVGYYIPDIIVDDAVLVEIKSKEFLTDEDYNQFWNYLKGSKYKVGLLVNFGSVKLEIKRVVYDGAKKKVSASDPRNYPCLPAGRRAQSAERGFTLMEITVATVIFAIIFTAMLGLFNYILKLNRQSEAVRQASQGARDFVEYLVKEIRNGQIDYYATNGTYTAGIGSSPCQPAGTVGHQESISDPPPYAAEDNKLGIISTDNVEECFYYGGQNLAYLGPAGPSTFSTTGGTLVAAKGNESPQAINPPNFNIDQLMFIIRPVCDPYQVSATKGPCSAYTNGYPSIQPSVTIFIKFTAKLPTGEKVSLSYETAVSENQYDIP